MYVAETWSTTKSQEKRREVNEMDVAMDVWSQEEI